MSGMVTRAVILAAGAGSRMRKADAAAGVDAAQARAADAGSKGMIPFGRPFLDYVIHTLADAGISEVCLVIGPGHREIRAYYEGLKTRRVRVGFAVQKSPEGTADAVLAAADFAGDRPFVVINSDNYYPRAAFETLAEMDGPGVALFDRAVMAAAGNIDADRLRAFAVADVGADGNLVGIVEKPDEATMARVGGAGSGVSMNCWRFGPAIFEACRKIGRSPRGEFELPTAVAYSMEKLGERYRVRVVKEAVLDLSKRSDIASVGAVLAGKKVDL